MNVRPLSFQLTELTADGRKGRRDEVVGNAGENWDVELDVEVPSASTDRQGPFPGILG